MSDEVAPGDGLRGPSVNGTHGIERLRVLYAEDHPAMQRAIVRLLQVSGASVVSAYDGLEATERGLAETFDLIVMDLRMPQMDGLGAARALRAGGCRVPVVGVTADASPAASANALAAGFDAVLTKPFGLGDLMDALRLVRERQPAQTSVASGAEERDSGPP